MNIINMFDMKEKISSILTRDKNNVLIGGGNSYVYEIFKLIVGIMLIITGLFIFNMRDYWNQIQAKVINVYDSMNQCQVNITYTIEDVVYRKNIVLPTSYNCNYSDKIDIYYYMSNPNIVQLSVHNYFIFGLSLIILGCLSLFSTNEFM